MRGHRPGGGSGAAQSVAGAVTGDRAVQVPRSCDLLGVVDDGEPVMRYLVWLTDESGSVTVRAARTLGDAARTARAYRHAWGGRVDHIEDMTGGRLDTAVWASLVEPSAEPLPYLFTVELRTCDGVLPELVTALWTTADFDTARRWRDLLPAGLRRRALIVTDAPTGRPPRPPWATTPDGH